MATRKGKTDFAAVLAELEALVETLEDNDTSLEQSMEAFEKGIALSRAAQKLLEEAEQKVMLLTQDEDGDAIISPLENGDE